MQDTPWREARRRDFPGADEGTVAVLRERIAFAGNGQQWGAERSLSLPSVGGAERNVYTWLSKAYNCDRCGQEFTDATNTPASCSFHPGILFSGGQLNGAGLRFTCCNRRAHHIPNGSRDSNGCSAAFHAGGQSAWQRHGTGVRPREQLPEALDPARHAGTGAGSSGRGGGGSSGAAGSPPRQFPWVPSKDLQEWHPNQRYGLLELPSRLLFGSCGANGAGA
ncbi:hypothetical protein ABPG77_005941 [Micractinium sp. CCAP 211/92]